MAWLYKLGWIVLLLGLFGFLVLGWPLALLLIWIAAPAVFAGATARALKRRQSGG
ncbi:MAG: hypothetical protein MEQ07_11315 [Aquimonas sp.]|nr:hypothetical protein [Aquimonas sp.]